jgi:hypothetical protein
VAWSANKANSSGETRSPTCIVCFAQWPCSVIGVVQPTTTDVDEKMLQAQRSKLGTSSSCSIQGMHMCSTTCIVCPLSSPQFPEWAQPTTSMDNGHRGKLNPDANIAVSYLHCLLRSVAEQCPGSGPGHCRLCRTQGLLQSPCQVACINKHTKTPIQHTHMAQSESAEQSRRLPTNRLAPCVSPALSAALSGRAVPWERPRPLPPVLDSGARPQPLSGCMHTNYNTTHPHITP